jgi:hypothetical protein
VDVRQHHGLPVEHRFARVLSSSAACHARRSACCAAV